MTERAIARLRDIVAAISRIESYTQGKTFDDYRADPMLRDAVERNIERISEASRHVGDAIKAEHAEVPWHQIASIGNVLRHEYRRVNDRTVWETIERHLKPLLQVVLAVLADVERRKQP